MIQIGEGIVEKEVAHFCGGFFGKKFLIVDESLLHLYGEKMAEKVGAQLIQVPQGEACKEEGIANRLIHELLKKGAKKDSLLIGMGGGATCDLTGFVASIFMRGVPHIFIPTTLLAIVDASIGGKTAIDTQFGKNLIGSFYLPKAVFSDLNFLKTLPEKEWVNGRVEILKMGLVFDAALLKMREKEAIFRAAFDKVEIVEKDPQEKGVRRILNFGHTIAHALERSLDFALSHGEAVAIGCVVESFLSWKMGLLKRGDFEEVLAFFKPFSLKVPTRYKRQDFLRALSYDKKGEGGKVRFVLIDQIGHAADFGGQFCTAVEEQILSEAIDWMEKEYALKD